MAMEIQQKEGEDVQNGNIAALLFHGHVDTLLDTFSKNAKRTRLAVIHQELREWIISLLKNPRIQFSGNE